MSFVCVAALAFAAGGCSGTSELLDSKSERGLFSKPLNVFAKPDWVTSATDGSVVNLGPSGPVGPEELVGADGRCSPPVAEAQPAAAPAQAQADAAAPPADRRVGSMAGDLAGAPMPAATPASLEPASDPGLPQVDGGIALGMTECQAVRRAGLPSNVTIGADGGGERKVVLTYLGGTWPGIYSFQAGRLKEISRAPEPPKPVKPAPRKRTSKTTQAR